MSEKNYVSYGDAETILTEFANDIKGKVNPGYLKSTVGWTGKNLLPNNANSQTINGITFTINADGSISANGTASARTVLSLFTYEDNIHPVSGMYILSKGYSQENVILVLDGFNGSSWAKSICSSGGDYDDVSANIDYTGYDRIRAYFAIESGVTVSNIKIYPMLRPADISDNTYEPYHDSVDACKVGWDAASLSVKKNYARITKRLATESGITWTVNADGTITANGTATANSTFYMTASTTNWNYNAGTISLLPIGDFMLSNNGDGAVNNGNIFIGLVAYDVSNNIILSVTTANGEKDLSVAQNGYSYILYIRIANGQIVNNLKFYPMIRPASIENSDYAPYIPDNTELVPWSANGVLGAKNVFDIYNPDSNNSTLTKITNGVSLVVGSAINYANARYYLNIEPNTDYRVKFNAENIASGVNMVQIKGSNDNSTFTLIKQFNGYTAYDDVFNSGNYKYYTIQLFVTGASGASGDGVNYTNFMVWLASDTDTTYQPYAKTNRELTEEKADKDDLYTDTTLNFGGTNYYKISGFNLATSYENVTLLLRSGGRAVILSVNSHSVSGVSPDAFGLNALSTSDLYNISLYHSRGESDIYVKANNGLAVQQIAGAKKNITLTSTTEGTATAKTTLTIYDVRKKADIIESPTYNNLVAMDTSGNIKDSGKKASDLTPVSATGTVETESTASQAYAIGEYFLRDGKFCTAIADIASGATLTLNTNYVEGTIADAIANKSSSSTMYNYSTTEHVVGKWIDGSTVYEKTIDFGAMPDSTTKSVDAGLPSGVKVIKLFGFTADNSWANVYSLPFADSTTGANYNFKMWYTNGNVSVKTTTGQSHMVNGFITIQYIKSSS